jgi:hypothetical protein
MAVLPSPPPQWTRVPVSASIPCHGSVFTVATLPGERLQNSWASRKGGDDQILTQSRTQPSLQEARMGTGLEEPNRGRICEQWQR